MFEQEQVASYVSMKLSNNAFNDENYIARVPRDTVSVNGIVSEIVAGTSSLDAYVILHAAELLKAKILELLTQGRSVNVLELGTMYLKPTGTVTKDNPQVSDLPGLTLEFTPSTAAKEAIAEVSGISFMINDSAPEIQTLLNLKTQEESVLSAGAPVRVTGAKMKMAVNESGSFEADNGIWIVPALADGTPDTNTADWIAVDAGDVFTNYAKKLEFWLPSTLITGTSYFIRISTTYLSKDERRKTAVASYSLNYYPTE